jgi:hypothetical protein
VGKKAARMGTAGRTGAAAVEVPDTAHNGAAEGVVGSLQNKGWEDSRPVNTLVL